MKTLDTGDRFPDLTAPAVDGSEFTLPSDLQDVYGVIVFYRGHW